MTDYRPTLNLPQTNFPMKADLVRKEPEFLEKWKGENLYREIQKKNEGRPRFVLHDGPPYANGSIHFGHILNKILKDIIVKYKGMSGFQSPFVPGWDCHGLPIEHQVDKDLGARKIRMSKSEIRKACREYAQRFVEIQKTEFRRLGILADWENPYTTMNPLYESAIARELGRFAQSGNIYKGKKPVLWCPHCQTALAEAEIEYEERESPSIYVRFPMVNPVDGLPKLKGQKPTLVIWTTTPWTLPANLAVALHPNYDYVAISLKGEIVIVAKGLVESFCRLFGEEAPEPLERFSAKRIERQICQHPFLPRSSLVVLSDHVTMDAGTGCVHTAPGHGQEDFVVGQAYGLETLTPVDATGRFTEECGVPEWVGQKVFDANAQVVERLKKTGTLLREEKIRHSYPHCWRCKNPVVFRATEQWFLSLEKNDLRGKAIDAIRRVQWVPAWGRDRILGMIQNRPDWCLSRQRCWGVPIIAFRCQECSHYLLDPRLIEQVAERMETEGSDLWFDRPISDILSTPPPCPQCGKRSWEKETDILDVWFDSGVSFAAVLEKNNQFPADLYLEGNDQHRGWFHSSLLASIGTRGRAPYKTVLTHGFVVDGEGRKYSKSARNYVPPEKVLNQYGSEILRLWVAAEDYRNDIRVSNEILSRLVDAYRKIRNTFRFLLGNLHDFDPNGTSESFHEIDRWALHSLQKVIQRMTRAYEEFNFHVIFHELNRFCTVDLSAFYLDILKDRLYTSHAEDPARRAAQRALFETASALARLVAPILSFTAEEVWTHLPSWQWKTSSVHLASLPEVQPRLLDETLGSRWEKFRKIRDEVMKALESARNQKVIGSSLEAKVILVAEGEGLQTLEQLRDPLASLFIVSQVEWGMDIPENATQAKTIPNLFIAVQKADGKKCSRCWNFSPSVGEEADLCSRCLKVIHTTQ